MVKKTKKIAVQLLKIIFAVGIIYWLVQSGKLNFSALRNLLTPGTLLLAVTITVLNFFLASERWRVLVKSQGIPAKVWSSFKLTLIGQFFNFAMPGGVGGDVIKAYYFTREFPGTKVVAATSVLMDRVLGLYAMIFLALAVMIYDFSHVSHVATLMTLFYFIIALFIVFTVALSLIFSSKVYKTQILKRVINKLPLAEKFMKIYESLHLYGNSILRIAQVIGISLIAQSTAILFLYMVGVVSGYTDIPAKTYFLVAPLGFMATAIPISPAGVGVGQAAFYFLFNIYTGHSSEVGPTTITAFQVCSFVVSLSGAFFYMRYKRPNDMSAAADMA
ncbi:lysylphosphatidylglycerol synthase transmembrane domain-containing protein [Bdellovibrio sp. KM01]|uniref:lysylphosphatidylglycerol synthase transmembrane domain-containing protein n=1 Tax=Bdellovibrio sp. KM01 TaxID=2748865 RepID=UPI0015EA3C25|nr:lysylphosphatidylglycerol synthase transmembrane domain-containing protein [Bdellovibrio sp. KM01]QLY26227.1 flippase-like domain-containing protein [Bdellovibrio sp. KM01]